MTGLFQPLQDSEDTITLSNEPYGYNYSNVTVASSNNTSGVTITSGTGISYPYTTTGVNYPTWTAPSSSKIKLEGPEADIEVNGESLMGLLREISERLRLMRPNEKLESEWEELRELGEQYRKLEKHIKEKQATWDKLKAMPAPEID